MLGIDAAESRVPGARLTLLLLGLLGLALIVGLVARWQILPDRPLAVDEYYMVRSTEFVLEHGVPSFPTGGYYTRALPLQYLMAGAARLFGETPLSYRLPAFLASLLSIVLAYWYARRFMPVPVSLAVALALLVSSWHIEFAGFARMYTLFQCIVLVFLIVLDDAYFRGVWRRRYLPHGLAVLACLTHAIGITLTPLLFLPLVTGGPPGGFRSWPERLRFAAAGLVTTGLCLIFLSTNFRGLGVENPLPDDYGGGGGRSSFNLPLFPFWSLLDDPLVLLILVAGICALGLALAWTFMRRRPGAVDLWLVALLVCSAAHLFTLAAIVFFVLVLRYDLHRPSLHPVRVYGILALAVLVGVGWLGLALALPEALQTPAFVAGWELSDSGRLKALWTFFFGWPDVYRYTIQPFLIEMPVLGLLLAGALVIVLVAQRHQPLATLLRQPWVILVATVAVYGVVEAPYSRLRYWYHLYPVMFSLIALAVVIVADRLARARPVPCTDHLAAFAFLGLFALTSDFDPRHIAAAVAGDKRVTFRTAPFEDHEHTWYQRYDFRTPATFVNYHARASDLVVVEYHFTVSYYLNEPHAIYIPREWHDLYPLHSREGGTRDMWSGQPLLDTPEELRAYTQAASSVWLIRGTDRSREELPDPEAVWETRIEDVARAYRSRDERIEVLHVTLGPPETSSFLLER
jgi:hypothetical protein